MMPLKAQRGTDAQVADEGDPRLYPAHAADTYRASGARSGGWDDFTLRRLEEFARRVRHDRRPDQP
jgi:hypothetical protein